MSHQPPENPFSVFVLKIMIGFITVTIVGSLITLVVAIVISAWDWKGLLGVGLLLATLFTFYHVGSWVNKKLDDESEKGDWS